MSIPVGTPLLHYVGNVLVLQGVILTARRRRRLRQTNGQRPLRRALQRWPQRKAQARNT